MRNKRLSSAKEKVCLKKSKNYSNRKIKEENKYNKKELEQG